MDRPHARYRDIAADLRERIRSGMYAPGANLPRMQDLAAEFDTNRDTIGRAITVLESEGLVWAVPPAGHSGALRHVPCPAASG
jgi:DNA-binding GntR family transcriptional regulator